MPTQAQTLGILGEELACQHLSRQGYKILIRNYECSLGEIDLIAKHNGSLVFVEVKTRSSHDMGHPSEAVNGLKIRQIVNVAKYYLKRYGINNYPCRFDVVSVSMLTNQEPAVELIQNAFEAS